MRRFLRSAMIVFSWFVVPYSRYTNIKVIRRKLPPIRSHLLEIPAVDLAKLIRNRKVSTPDRNTNTHTHSHAYVYVHTYAYVQLWVHTYVCVYASIERTLKLAISCKISIDRQASLAICVLGLSIHCPLNANLTTREATHSACHIH